MTRQNQSVEGGGTAIQSAGDTTINQGVSPEQMDQIIETIAAQLPKFVAVAQELQEARLKLFKEDLLRAFGDESRAHTKAFRDPDFLHVVGNAQHAYARSGDEQARGMLIDLVSQRSKQETKNRLSLALNSAIDKVSLLTSEEIAEAALCFSVRYTRWVNVNNFQTFYERMIKEIVPVMDKISREPSSYQYLVSQGCATIEVTSVSLRDIMLQTYPGLFSKGFALSDLPGEGSAASLLKVFPQLLAVCLNNPLKVQLGAVAKDSFEQMSQFAGLTQAQVDEIWGWSAQLAMSQEEMMSAMDAHVPGLSGLFSIWDDTSLKHMQLTPLGIAIGHADLARRVGMNADLAIWIK